MLYKEYLQWQHYLKQVLYSLLWVTLGHGDKLCIEALVQLRDIINAKRTIRMGFNHDPLIPPLGQFNNARIIIDDVIIHFCGHHLFCSLYFCACENKWS